MSNISANKLLGTISCMAKADVFARTARTLSDGIVIYVARCAGYLVLRWAVSSSPVWSDEAERLIGAALFEGSFWWRGKYDYCQQIYWDDFVFGGVASANMMISTTIARQYVSRKVEKISNQT